MAGGDLAARARLQRRDEIGALGEAFDQMAASLQRLDQAKSDFVGTVSHELRTPLTSLRTTLDNLGDGLLGELQPRQREALQRAQGEVERLRAIVRDTLQLARLEAGAEPLRAAACDLGAVVGNAVEALAGAAAARSVQIEVHGHGRCRGDAELLQRVAANLLENAIKFSPEGGRVTVELGDGLLRVCDQGPGFTTDRPFDAFVQGASAGVKNPGVGLGLAIVRRLVRLHGGEVTAQSDHGGVVTVRLPEGP
jgi:signal transduction histidine kinase